MIKECYGCGDLHEEPGNYCPVCMTYSYQERVAGHRNVVRDQQRLVDQINKGAERSIALSKVKVLQDKISQQTVELSLLCTEVRRREMSDLIERNRCELSRLSKALQAFS